MESFSGAIIQSKIPYDKILLNRGKRYKGFSKMNFNNLILQVQNILVCKCTRTQLQP